MRSTIAIFLFICANLVHSDNEDLTDYSVNESDGHAYKIMYKGETWSEARDICAKEGTKLAVPKTKDEFLYIQKIVRNMEYKKITGVKYQFLVWVGVNNLEDYRVWKNVDGEDINSTDFHKWSSSYAQNSRPDPAEPHCAGVDAVNPGLREFWCHLAQPYICEKIVKNNV